MSGPKRKPQPGSDQLDQWRRAIAANNAAKRNRRGRRTGPQITGIVIKPAKEKP